MGGIWVGLKALALTNLTGNGSQQLGHRRWKCIPINATLFVFAKNGFDKDNHNDQRQNQHKRGQPSQGGKGASSTLGSRNPPSVLKRANTSHTAQ